MTTLKSTYLGIELENPIVVGSSGLTNSISSIKKLENYGAGAIVLKSIFEEEILLEFEEELNKVGKFEEALEFLDYFDYEIKRQRFQKYTDLIKGAKAEVNIPVIASINCYSATDWIAYAKELETAGADALELNLFLLPIDIDQSAAFYQKTYNTILEKIKLSLNIPVGVKISPLFTNLGTSIKQFSQSADGVILFNRFYNPDIDINAEKVSSGAIYSDTSTYYNTLRWISVMHSKGVNNLVATGGISDGETLIKMLLAGAQSVEVVSAIYQKGATVIQDMLRVLKQWMKEKNYKSIEEFRGKVSKESADQSHNAFERAQFMRYFGEHTNGNL